MSQNFVEILIGASISGASITNINNQIKDIQKNIQDLDVSIAVRQNASNNKVFEQMESQINSLQNQIKELEGKLKNFGNSPSSKSSGNPFKSAEEGAGQTLKTLAELNDQITKSNGRLKVIDDKETGKVKQITTLIKDEFGKIEKLKYTPTMEFDEKGVQLFKANIREIDTTSFEGLNKKLEEAKFKIEELNRQGLLTKSNYDDLNQKLEKAFTVPAVDKLMTEMKQLGKISTNELSFDKAFNNLNKILDDAEHKGLLSAEALHKLRMEAESLNDTKFTLAEKLSGIKEQTKSLNNELDKVKRKNEINLGTEKARNEIEKLNTQLTKVVNSYKRTVNMEDVNSVRSKLSSMSENMPEFSNLAELKDYMKDLGTAERQIKSIQANATVGSRNAMTVIESFRTAMEKFTIWIGASTIFFGAIRGVQDLTDKVLELDKQMTNLRRVMELPDYKFNELLEKSIDNTTALSGKLNEYLELVNEFGRMGYDDIETIDLSNTAQTLANISDLTASESVSSLVAAMIAFNYEASQSIDIANKLNEVDNNFSVTTKDLAQSLNKSANVANVYGASLDQLLGYTTAITSATRESGNISGNALKTIMSRMTTNSNAINALEAVNVSINDIEGNVRPVSDIIDELAGKWDSLTDRERQMTAVRVAGTQQLTRFSALMNNYQSAIDATNVSLHSQGSAMNEQEKYNESLEARINRLNTAWYGLSNALGEGIIYDSIVSATGVMEAFVGSAESGAKHLPIIPVLFASIGTGALLLSTRVKGLTASTLANISAFKLSAVTDGIKATSLRALSTAAVTAGTALKSLGLVVGVSMALGYGLDFLIKKYSETKQKQEEMNLAQEKNISALTDNKDRVEDLIYTYDKLSKYADAGTLDADGMQQYLDIQNELGELFPSLIGHIDATGQSHLISSKAIAEEVKMTKELIKAQKEEQQAKAFSTINDSLKDIEKAESEIKRYQKSIENVQKNFKEGSNGTIFYDDTRDQIEGLSELKTKLRSAELQAVKSSQIIAGKVIEISDAFTEIEIDPKIKKELDSLMYSLDFKDMDASKLESFAIGLSNIATGMQKAYASGDNEGFNNLNTDLNTLLSTTNNFTPKINSLRLEFDQISKSSTTSSISLSALDESLEDASMNASELDEKISDLAESIYELKSAEEQLAGVSQKRVDSSEELLFMYESLSSRMNGISDEELSALLNKEKLTAEEKVLVQAMQQRGDVIAQLSVLYPQYTKLQEGQISLSYDQIEAMRTEEKANKTLLESYKLASEGKYSAEQEMTLAQASGTKARIDNIKKEIEALNILNQELQKYISDSKAMTDSEGLGAMRASNIQASNNSTISDKTSELSDLQSQLNTSIGSLNGFNSAIEDSSKSSKKSNDTLKESIYVTDEYKNSLEALNLEIAKQEQLRAKEPEYSKKYQASLEAQIKLEKQKLELQQKQAKALEAQIKSGKIQQTGLIDTTPSSSSSSTSSTKIHGADGKITSGYGMRMHPTLGYMKMHDGIDIKGNKGDRLDSFTSGKVIAQDYNSVSGNYVKIEDSNGFKHLYAHLDKAFAKVGDLVEAGTQIGTIGSTGRSTGSHLHYEVKNANGNYLNPSNFVNSAKNNKVTTSSSSGKSASTIQAENAQAVDQANSELISINNDILSTQSLIDNLNEELVKSNISYYDSLIEGVDRSIKKSNILANQQLDYSQAYRDELANEIKQQEYKQNLLHKQAEFIRTQLNNEDLTPALKSDLTAQLSEITLSWWDVEEAIEGVKEAIEESKIAEFDKTIEDLNDTISKSNTLMDLYTKGTKEYNDEQKKVISTLHSKQKAYEDEAQSLRSLLATEKLTAKERERNQKRLNELAKEWISIQSEIMNVNASIADDIISVMKESYEQQRDLALAQKDREIEALEEAYDAKVDLLDKEDEAYKDSIQSQMDELEKAHQDKLDKLEKEGDAFEEAINRQLRLMRDTRDEEDFNKDISGLQKNEANIQSKINELSMDDSREAGLKRRALEEELANVRTQIAEKQRDRQYSLREQNLQDELDSYNKQLEAEKKVADESYDLAKKALDDQLEFYNKEFEAKKKMEEDKYNASKKQLERERKEVNNHYDQLINDEQKYADLRAQIINGNVDGMSEKLKGFLESFKQMNKDTLNELDMSWQELQNKINRITQSQSSLSNVSTPSTIQDLTTGKSSTTLSSTSPSTSTKNTERDSAWQTYLANKKAWDTASKTEKARLTAENESLRKKYGFQDGSYDNLKNLQKYHTGGIVGGKGNRLTELANKLFNTKPNEQTVLALKRELFAPEDNIPNLFTNIRSAIPDFKTQQQGGIIQIDNLLTIENVSQNANLDIDRLLDKSMDRLIDRMKPYGFKMR